MSSTQTYFARDRQNVVCEATSAPSSHAQRSQTRTSQRPHREPGLAIHVIVFIVRQLRTTGTRGKRRTDPLPAEDLDPFATRQLGVRVLQRGYDVRLKRLLEPTPPFSKGASVVCGLKVSKEAREKREDTRGPMFSICSMRSLPFDPALIELTRQVTEGRNPPERV